MAYVGTDFTPARPGESEPYGFDFKNDLPTGDALTSGTATLTVVKGRDSAAASRLQGGVQVAGTKAFIRVTGLLVDVVYALEIAMSTTQSNTLKLFSHIPCVPIT